MTDFLRARHLAGFAAIRHGFGTALLPAPPAASGDVASAEAFKAQSLAAAREAALRQANAASTTLVTLKQIHTTNILVIRALDAYIPPAECIRGDALISDCPGILIGIKTADCLPLLLAAPERGVVAAVHAGWRGSEAKILRAVIRRLKEQFAVEPAELYLAFGPSARACCYEVDEALAARFADRFGAEVVHRMGEKAHLDLSAVNRRQAEKSGILAERMEDLGACTLCSKEPRFYSYRREGQAAGRLLNYIGLVGGDEGPKLRLAGLALGAEKQMRD